MWLSLQSPRQTKEVSCIHMHVNVHFFMYMCVHTVYIIIHTVLSCMYCIYMYRDRYYHLNATLPPEL